MKHRKKLRQKLLKVFYNHTDLKKNYLIFILLLLSISFLSAQESKRLYTGLRLGGSVGMTYPLGDAFYEYFGETKHSLYSFKWREGGSFDVAPFVSLQITDGFALHTEVMLTKFGYWGQEIEYQDEFEAYTDYQIEYTHNLKVSRRALMIPIFLKHTHRKNRFSFQYYIGPHFTINFGKWEYYEYYKYKHYDEIDEEKEIKEKTSENRLNIDHYPPVGLTIGTNFGFITTKAGTFFLDARVSGDLGVVKENGGYISVYRGKLSFSLGYEIGLINR